MFFWSKIDKMQIKSTKANIHPSKIQYFFEKNLVNYNFFLLSLTKGRIFVM